MTLLRKLDWYENHERVIPGHHHIAGLVELLLQRGYSSHQILKRTKLFYDDILTGRSLISPAQYCQIIRNATDLYNQPELSFLWGHSLYPGNYDGPSQLISHVDTLSALINIFCQYPKLTPLMTLTRWEDEHTLYLEWSDAIGLGSLQSFLVEAYSTGIVSLINWYFGEKLPWRHGFSEGAPTYIEEYEVNLGRRIQFNMGMNLIMLDKQWLQMPIPLHNRKPSSNVAFSIAKKQSDDENLKQRVGFVQQIKDLHITHMPNSYNLDELSALLNMSPATFKRKLGKHQTNFQRLQDRARLSVSLRLMQQKDLKTQDVAEYFEIRDVNNFRRAFKRWCGMTPAAIKERLV